MLFRSYTCSAACSSLCCCLTIVLPVTDYSSSCRPCLTLPLLLRAAGRCSTSCQSGAAGRSAPRTAPQAAAPWSGSRRACGAASSAAQRSSTAETWRGATTADMMMVHATCGAANTKHRTAQPTWFSLAAEVQLCCAAAASCASAAARAPHLMRLPPRPLNQAHMAARCCLMCSLAAGLSNLYQQESSRQQQGGLARLDEQYVQRQPLLAVPEGGTCWPATSALNPRCSATGGFQCTNKTVFKGIM